MSNGEVRMVGSASGGRRLAAGMVRYRNVGRAAVGVAWVGMS